jgi:GcrA cell cycle regulator
MTVDSYFIAPETNSLNGSPNGRSLGQGRKQPNGFTTQWTAEKVEQLKKLWGDGATGAQISEILGFSRGGILGKIKRLCLPTRKHHANQTYPKRKRPSRPKQPKPARPRRAVKAAASSPPPPVVQPPLPSLDISLMDLRVGQCRYPYGEGESIRFCGNKQRHGSSYCSGHHKICNTRPTIKRDPRPFTFSKVQA